MKATQKELTNWAINQIKTKYPDDIALLVAIEGHALPSDCHGECFDYFVPVTDRGNELATTFILDGVGHDLYPRSWQRIENMAEFNDDFHNGLADAIVLYYRNEDDLEKFEDYRSLQKKHLSDPVFMYRKALEKLDMAMEIYKTLMFEDKLYQVRMGAGYIANYLSMSVAFMNHRYFKQRLELPTIELAHMEKLPQDFLRLYESIVEVFSVETLKLLSQQIIKTTRLFLQANHVEQKGELGIESENINYQYLAEWYQECSLAFRRMRIHCNEGNYKRVFVDALNVQNELNIIKEEFDLQEMNILGNFDSKNLEAFEENIKEVENYIMQIITSHGIVINQYDCLETFLEENR